MSQQQTATAFMRIKHIKFTHILLPHILQLIQQDHPRKKHPVASIKVKFSDNGEVYGADVRLAGDTLAFVSLPEGKLHEKVIRLNDEVKQYLLQACKEAGRIVQPIEVLH
ncbi:hypothetical protein [Hymenobacter koreensis]|uniref:DUF2218 domain-containing protein n=1 Tax=Hymenobacter koreensis TaxID=1084523 RepID=A0ABP8JMZ0_9BACT